MTLEEHPRHVVSMFPQKSHCPESLGARRKKKSQKETIEVRVTESLTRPENARRPRGKNIQTQRRKTTHDKHPNNSAHVMRRKTNDHYHPPPPTTQGETAKRSDTRADISRPGHNRTATRGREQDPRPTCRADQISTLRTQLR